MRSYPRVLVVQLFVDTLIDHVMAGIVNAERQDICLHMLYGRLSCSMLGGLCTGYDSASVISCGAQSSRGSQTK